MQYLIAALYFLFLIYLGSVWFFKLKGQKDKEKRASDVRKLLFLPVFYFLFIVGILVSAFLLIGYADKIEKWNYLTFLSSIFLTIGLTMIIYSEGKTAGINRNAEKKHNKKDSLRVDAIVNEIFKNKEFIDSFSKSIANVIDNDSLKESKKLAGGISISEENIEKEIAKLVMDELKVSGKQSQQ